MTSPSITRADVGFRSARGPVLGSVMLCISLVAIDSTILATAVPSIVDDLGGFAQFPWLFSVYLLAQAVTVPIYGKLADQVGRKPVILFGVALFVLGSILCGAAWSMQTLIGARAVQGLGAGAIIPMTMTIVGDLYSVRERARVQGYLASVWGAASIVGPTLGGVFADFLTWRWIFFINLPLGALAAWMLLRHFSEKLERRKHRIDYAGALLLAVGASLLILGLLEGGILWAWSSAPSVSVLSVAAVLLVAFGFVERRAAEPILPGWVFGRRVLNGTNLSSLGVGALLIGLTSYVPLFVQGVLGTGALVAGFALAAMTVGWPIAASLAGRFYLRIGFRDTALMGTGFVILGLVLLIALSEDSAVWHVGASCMVIGFGLGFIASPTLVAAQSVVEWENRGVVTGTNMFARSLGSALGIAVFGAVANAYLNHRIGGHSAGATDVPAADLEPAIHQVFVGSAFVGLLLVVAVLLVPRHVTTSDDR